MKANVIKSLPIFTLYESLSYHCLIIMSNTTTSTTTQNVKARWAQRLVREKLSVEINALQENGVTLAALPDVGHPQWTHDNLPKDPKYKDGKRRVGGDNTPPRKVCIVGAGIAGLYIAMILDSLKVPNLTYDILEANSRVGGRIYTHHFSNEPHDYYDIGAMRFPHIPVMDRTFDLFCRTGMPLIPYYLSGPLACSMIVSTTKAILTLTTSVSRMAAAFLTM